MTTEKPALPVHERVFALVVVGFFVLMISLNFWFSEKEIIVDRNQPHEVQNPLIEVVVEGKVRSPGTYQVKKGTTVGEVIKMAEPSEEAKISKVKVDSKITRRRKIKIR